MCYNTKERFHAAVVESVDTLDSKSDEHYARAGSSPARGTRYVYKTTLSKEWFFVFGWLYYFSAQRLP